MTRAGCAREMDSLVRRLHRTLISRARETLGGPRLTVARMQLLWVIHRGQPIAVRDLLTQLYQSKSTVSAAMEGLAREGFLERSRPADDRRVVVVRLSRKGESVIRSVLAARQRLLARALRLCPAVDPERLVQMLAEVLLALDAGVVPAQKRRRPAAVPQALSRRGAARKRPAGRQPLAAGRP